MTEPGRRRANSHRSQRSARVSWVHGHMMPVVLASVLVAGLAAGIVVLLVGGGTKAGSSSSRAGAASEHAASHWAGPATKGSKWLDGSGTRLLSAVTLDLGKVTAAEQVGRSSTAEAAGAGLVSAAEAALDGSTPPVDAKVYRSALRDLEAAGTYVAGGQFAKAAPLLDAGEAGIMKVTAAADATVREKTPAIPEPAD